MALDVEIKSCGEGVRVLPSIAPNIAFYGVGSAQVDQPRQIVDRKPTVKKAF